MIRADATTRRPAASGDARIETLPVSFAQQRVWFLDQLESENPPSNIVRALRLRGPLDAPALRKALNAVISRHQLLRARFVTVDGMPGQYLGESGALELKAVDVSRSAAAEREREIQTLIKKEAGGRFDLSSDLMLRGTLIKLQAEEHVLALILHRIATEEKSLRILWRDLAAFYDAFSGGKPPALPELPMQYADFAAAQRRYLEGEALANLLTFWKEKLAGLPRLQLPTDRPRPPAQTFWAAKEPFALSRELSDALRALSCRNKVDLSVTLLAGFAILLHRYSRQDDVVLGTTVRGRSEGETADLIGLFDNHLPLRIDLSGAPAFHEVLRRARDAVSAACEHRALPFAKLLEELQPDRDFSRHPVFQAVFAFEDAPAEAVEMAGLEVSPMELDEETSEFDLTLSVRKAKDSLTARFLYNTGLFDAATVRRMSGHFETILQGIAADPSCPISEVPLLTSAERRQLLVEWNNTTRAYPGDKLLHELFEAQAERTPDAPAVILEDRALSYRQLNQRANQLARYLRKHGVGPDVLVGICVERSLDMLVAPLGILKAGGAYVPLDPAYPKQRLAFMLRDARVSLVLTQKHLSATLAQNGLQEICLDADWPVVARERPENLPLRGTAENLAYVIYTSGSTGKPKGVPITHRAVAIHSAACVERYELRPSDRVLQFASLSFDASAEELFPSWIAGAAVVLLHRQTLTIPEFLTFLRQQRLSVVNLPAPYWHEWVLELPRASDDFPPELRLVIVGNDKVSPQRFAAWRKSVGDRVRWMNAYGPTEATITATIYEPAAANEARDSASVPIGRPMANKQVYILDRRLNPVPIGVPGELHIGGPTLSRGYLNRPNLTAEKFIADPFGLDPGARLYKTGDLARYLADGNIEFLGRLDDQVKVRGFRIELGGIEAVLSQHPAVRQAVITAREDAPGKRLAAYVVAAEKRQAAAAELRSYLKEKLPDYMVPSAFVFMESLPLTPSGKIDRRALPAPSQTNGDRSGYVAPSHSLERQLAAIWEEYLGVRPIGVRDDFFELGGNSLIAARMMYGIEKACGRKVPLSTLFEGATIEHLGKKILENRPAGGDSLLVQVQPSGGKRPLFFLHGDFYGGGFYCLNLARALGEEQPFFALNTQGVNGGSMPRSIEAMAASYIELLRSAQPQGPYVLGGFCNGGVVAYEMARQLTEKREKVDLVMMIGADMLNTRFLSLYRLTGVVGALLGLEPDERADLFAVWRDRSIRCALLLKKILGRGSGVPGNFIAAEAGMEGYDSHIELAYEKLLDRHVPKPYHGRVVLFWPVEERDQTRRDPTAGWAKVAPQIDVQMIPGGHVSSIFEHVKGLAEKMRVCLDQAGSAV
jgi:aspartate racemase